MVGHYEGIADLACTIVRWVADEPQPGLVEAQVVDAEGSLWLFVAKHVYLTAEFVLPSSAFPIPGAIPCEVVGTDGVVVTVDTGDFDSDGQSEFRVPAHLVG